MSPKGKKREPFKGMTLSEIRRRPTLPGRFQPSTISVLRLNFCVRDGNRWIPQAIVTGNQTGFGSLCCRAFGFRQSAFELPPDLPSFRARFRLPSDVGSAVEWPPDFLRPGFRFEVPLKYSLDSPLAAPGFAPSKPHRPECSSPSDHDFDFHSSHILSQTFSGFSFRSRS